VSFAVSAIFIDGTNDRLYVVDQGADAVAIFDSASTLNGPITANRVLQGAATHLATPGGVQVDGLGRLVVSNASPPSITVYTNAAGVSGNQAPVAEIVGASTGMVVSDQIVIDPTGTGTLYDADPGAARVAVFSGFNTANGNIAPNRAIVGVATTLSVGGQPVGVAFDNTR